MLLEIGIAIDIDIDIDLLSVAVLNQHSWDLTFVKLLGSTGVVKKVGLVEWGFRLCQDSRVHCLLLSALVLSPSAPPVPGPFRVCQGASWAFPG